MSGRRKGRFAVRAGMAWALAALPFVVASCARSRGGGAEATGGGVPASGDGSVAVDAAVEAEAGPPSVPVARADGAGAGEVVANAPAADAAEEPPRYERKEGDPATLPAEDGRFVAVLEPVLDDFHMIAFRYPAEQTAELGSRDVADFRFGERTLRRIAARGTLDPWSTGALDVTFWKTDDGLYFVRMYGGCVAARDMLYGPFRAQGGTFVFARDARGTAGADGGTAGCSAAAGEWCPGVAGDPCGEHGDAASCTADERCVIRPLLDDTLQPCGALQNDCTTPSCPGIGCASRCNRLTDEAACTAQAPRCAWTDRGCSAPEGDCL